QAGHAAAQPRGYVIKHFASFKTLAQCIWSFQAADNCFQPGGLFRSQIVTQRNSIAAWAHQAAHLVSALQELANQPFSKETRAPGHHRNHVSSSIEIDHLQVASCGCCSRHAAKIESMIAVTRRISE